MQSSLADDLHWCFENLTENISFIQCLTGFEIYCPAAATCFESDTSTLSLNSCPLVSTGMSRTQSAEIAITMSSRMIASVWWPPVTSVQPLQGGLSCHQPSLQHLQPQHQLPSRPLDITDGTAYPRQSIIQNHATLTASRCETWKELASTTIHLSDTTKCMNSRAYLLSIYCSKRGEYSATHASSEHQCCC